jgi:lysophospholipase L1-like esterase
MIKKQMRPIILILACAMLSGIAIAETAKDAWYGLLSKKNSKRPEFAFIENDPALPNILLYGDSISIGYTQEVQNRLKGKANVYRLYRNGGDSDSFISRMTQMHEVMRDKKKQGHWSFQWDVIHFNIGLHDLKYTVKGKLDKENGTQVNSNEEYAANLKKIVTYLKTLSPKAKLIFATTTPVPEGSKGRVAGDAVKYNKVTLKVMKNHPEIVINDLYAFTKPNHQKWWSDPNNVHYNGLGRKAQGTEVARIILKTLDPKEKDK